MATLNQLVRKTKRSYRRVGRGQGSKRGKTSGRGGKGQTARSGHKIRPALRDIIKKLPKRRGYGINRGRTVNPMRVKPEVVTLEKLASLFQQGEAVSVASLKERKVISRSASSAKIIGNSIDKKLTIASCTVTAAARAAIEKAGGVVNV